MTTALKTKPAMKKDPLVKLSDELEQVLDKEAEIRAELAVFEEEEKRIRTELLKGMLQKGFQYVKASSGMAFGIVAGRTTYPIKKGFEDQAVKWAMDKFPGVLSISAAKLNKVYRMISESERPDFIEEKVGEPHLSVRGAEEVGE